eukprot:CAMPEP_0176192170 /NCGR_PEP_ID=MMETSP0121_2-20121125/4835_1 /TAXON_ID=160619 /ORGANISM="Kryptoperidinium foliaceum, Strain CCMP 1326" /LENGTH=104 /DNA_ID=CAMNT_0017530853 /DNA_START=224 /DNA_END=538 /DNA_ORIENTATION=+
MLNEPPTTNDDLIDLAEESSSTIPMTMPRIRVRQWVCHYHDRQMENSPSLTDTTPHSITSKPPREHGEYQESIRNSREEYSTKSACHNVRRRGRRPEAEGGLPG